MAAVVHPQWRLPGVAEMHISKPVLGRTLTTLTGAVNHINGIHVRGFAPVQAYQLPRWPSTDPDDRGYLVDERDDETHSILYWVPEAVDLLHVAMVCHSYESGGTGAEPSVTLTVEDGAGGVVDEGCAWRRGDGTLPGREREVQSEFWLPPYLVESDDKFESSDPTSGPTGPRRISVGVKAGNVVVVKLVTVRTLVSALYLLPVPPVTL